MAPSLDPQHSLTLRALAQHQDGVISRSQLVAAGLGAEHGSDRVASRHWRAVVDGVYLMHTGPIGFHERCWAAVLHCGPGAVLARASAAELHGLPHQPTSRASVVVPHTRRVVAPPWLEVVRQRRPILWSGQPPRTTVAVTALDLCDLTGDVDQVIAHITAAARAQRSMRELQRELARRRTVRHRAVLRDVLAEPGLESVLEHRYLRDVVRRHGLPLPRLQRPDTVEGRRIRSDAVNEEYATRVELDGRLHLASTDDDAWRDGWVAADSGHLTIRLRWRHVVGRPCRSAALVGRVLQRGGWDGRVRRCTPDCDADTPEPR